MGQVGYGHNPWKTKDQLLLSNLTLTGMVADWIVLLIVFQFVLQMIAKIKIGAF